MTFKAMSYLGAVTGNTRAKADEVLAALNKSTNKELTHVWGKAVSGEHSTGRALDFMVFNDAAAGEWIASYLTRNANRLGVAWVIWRQQFWSVNPSRYGPARQWNSMPDRGSPTENHMDHPHVLFASDSYTPPESGASPSKPAPPATKPASPATTPQGDLSMADAKSLETQLAALSNATQKQANSIVATVERQTKAVGDASQKQANALLTAIEKQTKILTDIAAAIKELQK